MSILAPQPLTLGTAARNATQSAPPGLWDGLVGAWVPALGFQGSTIQDLIGSLSGTAEGDPAWTNSPYGKAVDLDGTGDYYDLGGSPISGSANRTLVAHIYARSVSGDRIISLGQTTLDSGKAWRVWFFGGNQRVEIQGTGYTSALAPTTNEWITVAVTLDGSTMQDHTLYMIDSDGLVSESVTSDTATVDTASDLGIIGAKEANSEGEQPFDGQIASAYIWRSVLTTSEFIALHRDPLAPFRRKDDIDVLAAMIGDTGGANVAPLAYHHRRMMMG